MRRMLSSGIQIGVYSKLLDDTRKQMKDATPSPKSPEVGRQNPIKEKPNYLNDVTLHRNLHNLSGMTEMNQLVKREIHGPYSWLMNQNTGAGAYSQLLSEKKKSPLQLKEYDLKTPNAGGDTPTEQDPSIKVFQEEERSPSPSDPSISVFQEENGSPSHLSKPSSNTAQTGDDIPETKKGPFVAD